MHHQPQQGNSIFEHFSVLTDPRIERTKQHGLLDIVGLAICGVICGADGWTEIDGPIGPLFVAWSETTGITAAERSGDPDGFETEYEPSSAAVIVNSPRATLSLRSTLNSGVTSLFATGRQAG